MRKESFKDLVQNNYQVITKVLEETLEPLFTGQKEPEKYNDTIFRTLFLNRPLFPKQVEFVAAVEEYHKTNKCCIGFSDTGTGKTSMATALASLGTHKVIFIEVPPHLIEKTNREIDEVLGSNFDYDVIIVDSYKDIKALTKKGIKLNHHKTIYIVSKEKAKTTYTTTQMFIKRLSKATRYIKNPISGKREKITWKQYSYHCTHCYSEIKAVSQEDYIEYLDKNSCSEAEADENFFPSKKSQKKCKNCHHIIAGPNTKKKSSFKDYYRRVTKYGNKIGQHRLIAIKHNIGVYEFLKRYGIKNRISLGITDEFHESKGGDSLRGNGTSTLISMSQSFIGLTGTLLGGYASDAFYLLYRLFPHFMKKELGFNWNDVMEFETMFGGIEEHFDVESYDPLTGNFTAGNRSYGRHKRPDLSPRLFDAIMPFCIFLRLDEIKFFEGSLSLPAYKEFKHIIEAEDDFLDSYYKYASKLVEVAKEEAGRKANKKEVLISYPQPTNALRRLSKDTLLIPDMMYDEQVFTYEVQTKVIDPISKKRVDLVQQKSVTYTPPFTRAQKPMTNKMQKLIEIIHDNNARGRKVLIYCDFISDGVREEIEKSIRANTTYKVEILPDEISAINREKYIKSLDVDALITNPERVKTGLDLIEYPTIVYYEQAYTTFNVFTLRQASKRSWRIGQTQEVEVHAIAYASTQQQTAFTKMGGKINTSAGIEGRLSNGEDMASMAEDENMQIAMARAIMAEQYGDNKASSSSSVIDLNARDWDKFEQYYLNHLDVFKIDPTAYDEYSPKQRNEDLLPSIKKVITHPTPLASVEVVTEVIVEADIKEEQTQEIEQVVYESTLKKRVQLSLF